MRETVERADRERRWAELLAAALDGDGAAYRAFLEDVAPAVRTAAWRGCDRARTGGGEVEDIVQETLLALHLKRHTWRRDEPVGPWISAIARNKLVDVLRRRGRRAEISIDDILELPASAEADTAALDLGRMLDNLGARQKAIVKSISVEGHSVRDTAKRLNMSEGAIRVSLHRALKSLAAKYGKADA